MTRFPVLCTLCCAAFFLAAADINAHAQTFSVLYDFGTHNGDPANPVASGLIAQGRDGNLYTTKNTGAVWMAGWRGDDIEA